MSARLLLDTYVAIKLLTDPDALPEPLRRTIEAADDVFVSAVTHWEIEIKVGLGKLPRPAASLPRALETMGVRELPIRADHTRPLATLPPHHRDPFDRMLVAQSLAEGLQLITPDRVLQRYGDNILLC